MNSKKPIILAGVFLLVSGFAVGMLWTGQWNTGVAMTNTNLDSTETTFVRAGPFYVAVTMMPDPPKVGKNQIKIIVRGENQQVITGAKVRAVAEMAAMGSMPPMRAAATVTETQPGVYVGEMELSMSGEWPLAVDIEDASLGHSDLVFDMATGRTGLVLATSTPGDIAHYTCSMHTSVKGAAPGTCPICAMDLIPITHAELNAGTITVDAKRRQMIGVTTGLVKLKKIRKTYSAVGRITYDETRLSDISLKFDAWIGELYANSVGAAVKKGEPLFTVYSPELLSAQEEYLETIKRTKNRSLKNSKFVDAVSRKLRLWDLTPWQIESLKRSGKSLEQLPILAKVTGTVIIKHIVAGSAVKAGQPLLRVADLSRVWAEGQLYDHELAQIKVGMPATVILPDLQDREFKGKVNYIYPFMEGDTRTVRVRVELDNTDGFLRPDMYVHIDLRADLGERLVIPESAVLYAGRSRVAFLDLGDGRLQPRRIKTGVRNRRYIEVIDGLAEGDRVVTSGNFLIAAEAKLKAGIDQW